MANEYLKPQIPLKDLNSENYFYPLTTLDQIQKIDGSRVQEYELGNVALEDSETAPAPETSEISPLMNAIYPIGSIYMSVNPTSPATLFGGMWESLGGKFLIGQDDTYNAGSTGGSTTHVHNIEHTHTVTHTHTMAHTHTVTHTHTMAHTHSVTANGTNSGTAISKAQLPNYVLGDIPEIVPNSHGNWNNNHVASSNLGATSSRKPGVGQTTGNALTSGTQWSYRISSGGSGSTHTHTFTGSAVTSGASSAANTGESTPTTSASSAANTGESTPTTSASSVTNSGSTSTLPPYLAVYMWKRTA